MLIKKKFFNSGYFFFIKSLFNKLMFVLGLIFFFIIFSVFIYYFSSGLNQSSNAKSVFLKINETFLDRYLGVNILKLNDYTN